jgi:hypothetical protein
MTTVFRWATLLLADWTQVSSVSRQKVRPDCDFLNRGEESSEKRAISSANSGWTFARRLTDVGFDRCRAWRSRVRTKAWSHAHDSERATGLRPRQLEREAKQVDW